MMMNNINIFDYKTSIDVLTNMQEVYYGLLNILITHNCNLLRQERISILKNMEEIISCLCKKYKKTRQDVLNDIINNKKNED